MNGAEQVARFSATQRLEKRLEDLELVVETMAVETVRERDHHVQQQQVLVDTVNAALDGTLQRHVGLAEAFLAFEHQTLWQRLRWWVRGA